MKPKCEESLSNFALNFELRHYIKVSGMTEGVSRGEAARIFYQVLVLKTHGRAVQVDPGVTPGFRS